VVLPSVTVADAGPQSRHVSNPPMVNVACPPVMPAGQIPVPPLDGALEGT
jgi:hypothetical protein